MRFLHLSDLHIGKRVHNFSMLEDQKYILDQILGIADEENVTGVIIAGDVYDKPVPSAEAVSLFDEFLVQLAERELDVFVISGNHDSPERIAFGEKLMRHKKVYLSPVYNGKIEPICLNDEFGTVKVFLLPFIKPVHVRHFLEEEVSDYTEALACAISLMDISQDERNVLVCHQFVTGAGRSESEEISVGGLDNVDATVFEPFDYVALGHIHGPQNIGSERIRYCGTPLKYSFSEAEHKKSVTIVELGQKGDLSIRLRELNPMRDLIKIKGLFDEVTDKSFYKDLDTESYVQITLLDEDDIPNAFGKLATIYPNLMLMRYENRRTMDGADILSDGNEINMAPDVLFSQFYETMNNQPMTKEQEAYMLALIEKIWGDNE
jgi:exonuclease SbcD